MEDRIPTDHPLRDIQTLVNPVLSALLPRFQAMYATMGRPSIPRERLLRAPLLQQLSTIRSERQHIEQLHYNTISCAWTRSSEPERAPAWTLRPPTNRKPGRNRFQAVTPTIRGDCSPRQCLTHPVIGEHIQEHVALFSTLLNQLRATVAQRLASGALPQVLFLDVISFSAGRIVVVNALLDRMKRLCLGHEAPVE